MIPYLHVIPGWLELISLAFCIGVFVCRLWVFPPPADKKSDLNENLLAGMWRWVAVAVSVMIVCTISNLFVRAVEMSGSPVLSIFPVLPTVIFRTHFGSVWIIRLSSEVLSLVSLKVFRRYRDSRIFLVVTLCLMVVISATESASGHASDAGDFSLPEIADWIHLLAASVWGGGLFALSLFILRGIAGATEPHPTLIAGVASRFSRIAGFAVGLVAISAIYNGLSYVDGPEALWKSPYGLTVTAKIVLFLLLLNLGAFNRYVSVPLLQEWAGASAKDRGVFTRAAIRVFPRIRMEGSGHRVAMRFLRSVKFEAVLIMAVMLCAALLRHEIPARHLSHMGHADGKPMHMHQGGDTRPSAPDRPARNGN